MPASKPTFSDKELFATEVRGLPGQLDGYFEACDTLKRLMDLFMRNVASSTLPSEVVELEDVKAADREVCKQAGPFVTALGKVVDMMSENDGWFRGRMREIKRVDRERRP